MLKTIQKKFDLLKKLAFAEVYNLDHDNQVTLLFTSKTVLYDKLKVDFGTKNE